MEDKKLHSIYGLLIASCYFLLFLEILVYCLYDLEVLNLLLPILHKVSKIYIYSEDHVLWSKTFVYFFLAVVSLGSKPKKKLELKLGRHIIFPIILGTVLFFGSTLFYFAEENAAPNVISLKEWFYIALSVLGAITVHTGFDNISKIIHFRFMEDPFNFDNESFMQPIKPEYNPYSTNIPMQFYWKKKMKNGWFNITNPFRGSLVIGTPESGKTYSIIVPFIKNLISKKFSMLIYDAKYPDLAPMAYYEYLKVRPRHKKLSFHMINLNDVERSRRVNPLKAEYLPTLGDCVETANALIKAMRKGVQSSGGDQFFSDSAINFLAAVIYYFSKYENGRYSTLPHVLSFLNRDYKEIFDTLFEMIELTSLLDPFRSAYQKKSYNQLEGQIGTLKINTARLATPETFWVFSGDDFDLRISNPKNPSIVVLATSVTSESTNSSSNSALLNRMLALVNTKGNAPCGIIVDEAPTIYIHKIQHLISTARSNKVAVMLGLQELPQLFENYGKTVAETIISVTGNVISGAVRKKETLEWLEKLFGKKKQIKKSVSVTRDRTTTSINEQMDHLIPASKIAQLTTGEVVAQLAFGFNKNISNLDNNNTYHCRILIDDERTKKEESEYPPLPKYYTMGNKEEKEKLLLDNMERIRDQVDMIIYQNT